MEAPSLSAPNLFEFDISFIVNKPILFVVFVAYLVLYFAISAVLFYHWSSYGMKNRGILFARAVFTLGSIVLLVASGFALFYF